MSELIRIDFQKGELKTPNHIYRIVDTLTVDKYQEFLILQNEVSYGVTFDEVNRKHKEIYEALNKTDFVRASALLHNLMNSIYIGIDKRSHPIMRLCALFLIREDEDPAIYNEQINKEKQADWGGVDFRDFFHLAVSVVPGLLTALDEISRSISQAEKKVKKFTEKIEKNISGNTKLKQEGTGNG